MQGISKQAATGRTKDDTVFPLTVKFTDVSQNLSVGDLYSPSSTVDKEELLPLQKQVSNLTMKLPLNFVYQALPL